MALVVDNCVEGNHRASGKRFNDISFQSEFVDSEEETPVCNDMF